MSRPFLVNGRFSLRPITGVERYASDICRMLGNEAKLVTPPALFKGQLGHLWEQVFLPPQISAGSRLWSPANTGPLAVSNQVLTIHDLAPLDHPEWFNPRFAAWYRFMLPRLARRVCKIIAVSAFTGGRILERFGIPESHLSMIPSGVDLGHFQPVSKREIQEIRQKFSLRKPFLLFIGTLQPRKNLKRLLQAWEIAGACHPEVDLVLVGSHSSQFRDAGIFPLPENVRTLGRVDDLNLPAFYSAALGVVVPSLYEGSCLVGLEALACGASPIVSDIPVFHEILGEAAMYFDPISSDSISDALMLFLEDDNLRGRIVSRGPNLVEKFRLEPIAAKIKQVLNGA